MALFIGLAATPAWATTETHTLATGTIATEIVGHSGPVDRVASLVQRLTHGPFRLTDAEGNTVASIEGQSAQAVGEHEIVQTLEGSSLASIQADKLWELFADEHYAAFLTLPIVKALIVASNTPQAREAFWSELGGLAKQYPKKTQSAVRTRSLLGFVETHRDALKPLYSGLRDTESAGDDMVDMLQSTNVFGANFDQGLIWLVENNAAAVARRLERERGRGRPVAWENTAFDHMLRWKEAHLHQGGASAPRSLAALDAAGETFVVIFNSLHDFDEKYRHTMLRGLGPIEVFNAAVGGELELYRMGTSSYRDFMHAVIMRGIKDSGSFEAFLERAAPTAFGEEAVRAMAGRGLVLLRIVSSFGLLEDVLTATRDRERFASDAIASLNDPHAFEGNASVMLDLLTLRSSSPAMLSFQRALLNQLYARYNTEANARLRNVYGSVLSVYQTVSGDRRVAAVDRAFPLNGRTFKVPFARLFSPDGRSNYVHRMFMRFDQDVDATATYASFLSLMRSRGASVRHDRTFDVYRLVVRNRAIEIYANKPTAVGVKNGINDIAAVLRGKRVETVIGRGHTAIVTPLQKNAQRILGSRIKDVATVLVGTCGGDASMRDLIATFGYNLFFTTRSTGRQTLNNALIESYVTALMALNPGGRLDLAKVLESSMAPYLRKGSNSDLRDDASFYRLSTSSVLAAYLFDTHVKPHQHEQRASR